MARRVRHPAIQPHDNSGIDLDTLFTQMDVDIEDVIESVEAGSIE